MGCNLFNPLRHYCRTAQVLQQIYHMVFNLHCTKIVPMGSIRMSCKDTTQRLICANNMSSYESEKCCKYLVIRIDLCLHLLSMLEEH